MPAISVQLSSFSGSTDLELWLYDSGSLLNTGGDNLTEIGSTGFFSATVDENISSTLTAVVTENGVPVYDGFLYLGETQVDSVRLPANSDITAIKSKTDLLNFTVAGFLDVNLYRWRGTQPGTLDANSFVPANLASINGNTVRVSTFATALDNNYLAKLNVSGTLAHTNNANLFKADISGLATEANATGNKNELINMLDFMSGVFELDITAGERAEAILTAIEAISFNYEGPTSLDFETRMQELFNRIKGVQYVQTSPNPYNRGKIDLVEKRDYLIVNENAIRIPCAGIPGVASADNAYLTIEHKTTFEDVVTRKVATGIDIGNGEIIFELSKEELQITPGLFYVASIELEHSGNFKEIIRCECSIKREVANTTITTTTTTSGG